MLVLRTIRHGLRQALGAPKMLALLWLVNVALALPAAWIVTLAIEADVGASLAHQGLREGFDTDWLVEYDVRASGLGTLFSPKRSGAGVVYENLDGWFSGDLLHGSPWLISLALIYGALWVLFQGAVIDRSAHSIERFTLGRFVGAGGHYFVRFLQLAALGLVLYYYLYRLAGWAFGRLGEAFRGHGTETEQLIGVAILGFVFVVLLNTVRLLLDYAKIATVCDPIRFSPVALWQGARFVLARPVRTLGVYVGVGTLSLLLLAFYAWVAPGVGQSTWWSVALAFVVGQVFVVGRLFLRVALLSAETANYRYCGGM